MSRASTYDDEALAAAVASCRSWRGVLRSLGLSATSGSAIGSVRSRSQRLGLDSSHFIAQRRRPQQRRVADEAPPTTQPQVRPPLPSAPHLRSAGPLLAAGWLTLCGLRVSWPLEPARYDLLVDDGGRLSRVQVKTTTVRTGQSWTAWLSTTRHGRTLYDPGEIDAFLVVDGDLSLYLVPVAAVAGLHAIRLSSYDAYRIRDGTVPSAPLTASS